MSHIASVIKTSCAGYIHTQTHTYIYRYTRTEQSQVKTQVFVIDEGERTTLRAPQQASRTAHFRFRSLVLNFCLCLCVYGRVCVCKSMQRLLKAGRVPLWYAVQTKYVAYTRLNTTVHAAGTTATPSPLVRPSARPSARHIDAKNKAVHKKTRTATTVKVKLLELSHPHSAKLWSSRSHSLS